jgi:hypothetical protein
MSTTLKKPDPERLPSNRELAPGISVFRYPTDEQEIFIRTLDPMAQNKKDSRPKRDLDMEATTALEQARAMAPGPERTEAMKRAGILRNAADLQGLFFARRGRPAKT